MLEAVPPPTPERVGKAYYVDYVNIEPWLLAIPTGCEELLVGQFPSYLREALLGWMCKVARLSRNIVPSTRFVEFQNAARADVGLKSGQHLGRETEALPFLRTLKDDVFTNLLDYFASIEYFPSGATHPLEVDWPDVKDGCTAETIWV